jgi:phage N-6-adenine-methyltransferase
MGDKDERGYMPVAETVEWSTPPELFASLDAEFHFTLDPAATPQNAKCAKFFTEEQDGLTQDWSGERVFCNPPYGRGLDKWAQKFAGGGGC